MAPIIREIEIDLAAAYDNAAHLIVCELLLVANDGVEFAVRELFHGGHRFLVAQQALRAHHDERLAKIAQHLPAQ